MIFTDLVAGDSVFVDANTLVFRFSLHAQFGPACRARTSGVHYSGTVHFEVTRL